MVKVFLVIKAAVVLQNIKTEQFDAERRVLQEDALSGFQFDPTLHAGHRKTEAYRKRQL